jgi:hypothetical protein
MHESGTDQEIQPDLSEGRNLCMILTLSSRFHCARALVMGLALHAKAGKLLEKEQYKEALEVLELAEVRTARSHSKVWSLADALEEINK